MRTVKVKIHKVICEQLKYPIFFTFFISVLKLRTLFFNDGIRWTLMHLQFDKSLRWRKVFLSVLSAFLLEQS